MYETVKSIYTYEGTEVLKNKLDIKDEELLKEYQTKIVSFKLSTIKNVDLGDIFDDVRLKNIHKYLFEDVYFFAGEYRRENIIKGNFRFSEYEYIEENIIHVMQKINIDELKKLNFEEFIEKISNIMTDLNVLHPFRER